MGENSSYNTTNISNETINLRELVKKYIYHWRWFVISILAALALSFIYLRFATYEYQVSSTILINDEDNDGGSTSEISTFQDLGLFVGPKTSLDTEMGVLKSKTLIQKVVKELGLNVTYYTQDGLASNEVYQAEMPYKINLFDKDSKIDQLDTIFSIRASSMTEFVLSDSDDNEISKGLFGESVGADFGSLVATPITVDDVDLGKKILIKISPLEDVAINLKKRIEITPDNVKSNLLILTLKDPIKSKAKDILDNLVQQYNTDAVDYKSQIAQITDEFITGRIDDISVELTSLDQGVQTYKTRNKLSNMDSEAGLVLASNAELANQIVELTSQIKLVDYVTDYMKTNKDGLLPTNLGLLNQSTSQNTLNYNNLLLERNRLLAGANKENPVILNLDNQIASLRKSIDRSLINTKSSLQISLQEANLQESRLNSKISATPKKEREIRDIQRQQEIIETLYLYLLQKREENSISLAVTAPNAKIVDRAYGSNVPVAPRRAIVLIASLFLGFLIPASLLTVRSMFDNKVHLPEELESVVSAPIVGEIPMTDSGKELIDFGRAKSNAAESFRLLRTNIDHLLAHGSTLAGNKGLETTANEAQWGSVEVAAVQTDFKKGNVVFITSTIGGEGKTFVALNLASSMAKLGKSVLLIEANMRNPSMVPLLDIPEQKGLINFLTAADLQVTDVIGAHEKTGLDVIVAGGISEAPSELLSNGRFDMVLEHGRQHYDYVIIDTPSIHRASDTLLVAHYADLFVYVVRSSFLSKKILLIPKKLHKNRRLPNLTMVMNGASYEKMGYDSAYNYGQTTAKKPWWKKYL